MTRDTDSRIFEVYAELGGKKQQLQIKLTETTDGVPYYICLHGDEEIAQIREEDGDWKQLWGDLNDAELQHIGKAIADRSL
jgi:demethoxyubiquinone hydroxylase (CLK1/Coq7/Cat5 family)